MDIQILLIPQQLKTYSQVLTIAQKVEQGLEKKNRSQMKNHAMKQPFQQMAEEAQSELQEPQRPNDHFNHPLFI